MRRTHEKDILIAKNLKSIRKDCRMTMVDLGRKLSTSHPQIHKYESGRQRISASRLHDIAEILGVDINCFFKK